MIAAHCKSQLFRLHRNRGNFFGGFSKVTVMNNCRLAQDTFVLRQVISVFKCVSRYKYFIYTIILVSIFYSCLIENLGHTLICWLIM